MKATDPLLAPLPGMPSGLGAIPPKARDYEGMTLDEAIARSHAVLDEVCERWPAQYILGLFSGGGDSVILAHLLRERLHGLVLVNTTIRVPDTAQHVRAVAGAWRLPLAEPEPPDSYRDLVCGRVRNRTGDRAGEVAWQGFPGPAKHGVMYQRLKERALEEQRRQLVGRRGKAGQVVYVAGMRWAESDLRFKNAEEIDPWGAVIWCSAIVHWTDDHMREYRERHRCREAHDHAPHMLCTPGALPFNEVTANLHVSGDCACGSKAKKGEIHGYELFYPDTAAEIHDIEAEARACGLDIDPERLTWGWGADRERPGPAGRLCANCRGGGDDLAATLAADGALTARLAATLAKRPDDQCPLFGREDAEVPV